MNPGNEFSHSRIPGNKNPQGNGIPSRVVRSPELRLVSQSHHVWAGVWFGADGEDAESTSESSLWCERAYSFHCQTAHQSLEHCQLAWLCSCWRRRLCSCSEAVVPNHITSALDGFSCSLRAPHQFATSTMQFCSCVAAVAAWGRGTSMYACVSSAKQWRCSWYWSKLHQTPQCRRWRS